MKSFFTIVILLMSLRSFSADLACESSTSSSTLQMRVLVEAAKNKFPTLEAEISKQMHIEMIPHLSMNHLSSCSNKNTENIDFEGIRARVITHLTSPALNMQ